jgi:hypothetical protein
MYRGFGSLQRTLFIYFEHLAALRGHDCLDIAPLTPPSFPRLATAALRRQASIPAEYDGSALCINIVDFECGLYAPTPRRAAAPAQRLLWQPATSFVAPMPYVSAFSVDELSHSGAEILHAVPRRHSVKCLSAKQVGPASAEVRERP